MGERVVETQRKRVMYTHTYQETSQRTIKSK